MKIDPAYMYEKYDDFTINLKVDLRYSNRRILKELEKVLNEVRDEIESSLGVESVVERSGNIKTDVNEYNNYLKVWALRKKGVSWSKIQEMMDLESVQIGRNWYNRACELIEKGIPTLPEFPTISASEQKEFDRANMPWEPGFDINGKPLDPRHPWNRK
jgi:hypothetical protein